MLFIFAALPADFKKTGVVSAWDRWIVKHSDSGVLHVGIISRLNTFSGGSFMKIFTRWWFGERGIWGKIFYNFFYSFFICWKGTSEKTSEQFAKSGSKIGLASPTLDSFSYLVAVQKSADRKIPGTIKYLSFLHAWSVSCPHQAVGGAMFFLWKSYMINRTSSVFFCIVRTFIAERLSVHKWSKNHRCLKTPP